MTRFVLVVVAAAFATLHILLYADAPVELAANLVVDAALIVVYRFPLAVSSLALAVAVLRAVADQVAPGVLTVADPPMLATVPASTPVILWFAVHTLPRATALVITAAFTVMATRLWEPSWPVISSGLSTGLVPALVALYLKARQDLLASLRERAESAEREQLLLTERARSAEREQELLTERARSAEREQELLAERATAAERQRLASEMHDLVTHHVTEIVLRAGALKVSSADDTIRDASERIREAGARTLAELRELIGVLRSGQDTFTDHRAAAVAKVAVDDDLRTLAGDADLETTGEPLPMPPAVARAAYRLVQEALTNARKHAPGAPVRIAVGYGHDTMTIEVENGPATRPADPSLSATGSGTGLDGLRRRVTMLGGAFEAGPSGDGFRVRAGLPVGEPDRPVGEPDRPVGER
ncbi:histidine kinase [Nonomuraea rhizosphaerae]|uniref:histidine kinase n=1 Tax=Nonomuraea rhizosphaerae TaxID=2665663 RepID=UPI001C5EAC1D|nr:histidine kinase [Nonomuraea rhizosphaerae]